MNKETRIVRRLERLKSKIINNKQTSSETHCIMKQIINIGKKTEEHTPDFERVLSRYAHIELTPDPQKWYAFILFMSAVRCWIDDYHKAKKF